MIQKIFLSLAVACALGHPLYAQEAVTPPPADAAQYRYWTTNWSFQNIDAGKLLGRLRNIGVEVPIQVLGDVSVNFSVSIPLNGLRDAKAFQFHGTLESKQLQLEQLLLADFSTKIQYEAGVINLQDLHSRWLDKRNLTPSRSSRSSGQLTGNVSLVVVPRGALTAKLTANQLAIGPLYDLMLSATGQQNRAVLEGQVSGAVAASVPLTTLRDSATWLMDADLQVSRLSLEKSLPLTIDTGAMNLRRGKWNAANIRVESPIDTNVKMVASLSADLTGEHAFEFDVKGNDLPLQSLASLVSLGDSSMVTGKLDIDAHGSGKLGDQEIDSSQWKLSGRIASPALNAFGVQLGLIQHSFEFDPSHFALARLDNHLNDPLIVDHISANYSIGANSTELHDLNAAVFGGTVNGEALIARREVGNHQVKLKWEHINPQFDSRFILPQTVKIALITSGEVDGSVSAQLTDQPSAYNGNANIAIDNLLVGPEQIGNGQLALAANGGELKLKGNGELLGGQFSVDTTTSLDAVASFLTLKSEASPSKSRGEFRFKEIGLNKAVRLLEPRSNRRLYGFISGIVSFVPHEQMTLPQAQAILSLDDFAIDGVLLTRRLITELRVDDRHLTIDSLRGSYAGGQIDMTGQIAVQGGTGRLQVRVAAINASQGLLPISMTASQSAGGTLSGRLIVETGKSITANGTVEVRNSRVFSISTGDAHATIIASAANDLSAWTLRMRSIDSAVDNGKILGDAILRSSITRPGAFDLTSTWQARRLDFGRLLKDAGGGATAHAQGNIDGKLSLNGIGVRSSADLFGRFDAELDGTQARAVPGLTSAQAYLGALSLAGTRFDQGRIRGSIGSGTARINEFWLVGKQMQVFADGRVQIPSGRMDVSAVISTGNFDVESAALGAVAEQLAIGAAPPVALFIEANRLLSNRTLFVDILGPITDPRLRLKPLKNLESGVARFVAREATATFLPVIAGSGVLATAPKR